MKRKASALWKGSLKDGNGTISTDSGVLSDTQYSFTSRFADGKGTNPEELIAAAHAGCFSMALSSEWGGAGFTPESIRTSAIVTMDKTAARLCDHLGSLGCDRQGAGRQPTGLRSRGERGEERVSGVQGIEGRNHHGREARDLSGDWLAPCRNVRRQRVRRRRKSPRTPGRINDANRGAFRVDQRTKACGCRELSWMVARRLRFFPARIRAQGHSAGIWDGYLQCHPRHLADPGDAAHRRVHLRARRGSLGPSSDPDGGRSPLFHHRICIGLLAE